MLGIFVGSRRHANIAGGRGDEVAAQALGLKSLVSESSVCRALKVMLSEAGEPWLRSAPKLTYLLRPCRTANVKRLIEQLFRREDWNRVSEASKGWQRIEAASSSAPGARRAAWWCYVDATCGQGPGIVVRST